MVSFSFGLAEYLSRPSCAVIDRGVATVCKFPPTDGDHLPGARTTLVLTQESIIKIQQTLKKIYRVFLDAQFYHKPINNTTLARARVVYTFLSYPNRYWLRRSGEYNNNNITKRKRYPCFCSSIILDRNAKSHAVSLLAQPENVPTGQERRTTRQKDSQSFFSQRKTTEKNPFLAFRRYMCICKTD